MEMFVMSCHRSNQPHQLLIGFVVEDVVVLSPCAEPGLHGWRHENAADSRRLLRVLNDFLASGHAQEIPSFFVIESFNDVTLRGECRCLKWMRASDPGEIDVESVSVRVVMA